MLKINDVVKVTTPFTGEVIVFVKKVDVDGIYFLFDYNGEEYIAWVEDATKLN